MNKIPNVPRHERALYGGGNNVEFCKCENVQELEREEIQYIKINLISKF